MFPIDPPSSTSDPEPYSRDNSPSKGSEWSTTSEPLTKPWTPKKRAKSISSSDADWSDDSDTPVKSRALRRKGNIYDSPDIDPRPASDERSLPASDERSLPASDERSLPASDERSILSFEYLSLPSPADSRSDSEHDGIESENELPFGYEFDNPEEWETQHDTRDIDPLKLGKVPVRPLPLIDIHASIEPTREGWGLPPLKLRCSFSDRRHPHHIYEWTTKKLNCSDRHEPDCELCGASCCSVKAYTKAINEEPGPNPIVPMKYRKAFKRDIDELTMKHNVTDPFERMLRCDICYRNVCPDCAGRCMKSACLRIICKECGDPDPWYHCECEMMNGVVKISYI